MVYSTILQYDDLLSLPITALKEIDLMAGDDSNQRDSYQVLTKTPINQNPRYTTNPMYSLVKTPVYH